MALFYLEENSMSNAERLVKLLESAHLGSGVAIEECVITFDGEKARIIASDMTTSLYVQSSYDFESEPDVIGISNMTLFLKYLKAQGAKHIDISRADNKLKITPEKRSPVKFILAQVDLIPTYEEEWEEEGDRVATLLEEYPDPLALPENAVQEFLQNCAIIQPNSISISVSKRGIVSLTAGSETTDEFEVSLGKCKGFIGIEPIEIYKDHFLAVLNAVDFSASPTISIHEDPEMPIVVNTTNTGWIMDGLNGESPHTDE